MKKVKPIHAGLIAAVLLASVSTSAMEAYPAFIDPTRTGHWAPYTNPIDYFFGCTIFQQCEGSRWR